MTLPQKIAIFYEHPQWFNPMFAEFDRRGIVYDRLLAYAHQFDPAVRKSPYALVVNRMSPSAFTRGYQNAIAYTLQYLAYLDDIGANVMHGYETYTYEFSKARQLSLLDSLGVRYPKARAINHPAQAFSAAEGLQFPIVTKVNIGGSGAGIIRYDTPEALGAAAESNQIDFGFDGIALVQEFLPARDNHIVRVEVLDGKFLYAIKVNLSDTFNLCPADYCATDEEGNEQRMIEGYTPPQQMIETVERITAAAGIEVGGVEYLINDRDGEAYYYDINALSNFVADAPNLIGFDPFPRLVDFLLLRAGLVAAV